MPTTSEQNLGPECDPARSAAQRYEVKAAVLAAAGPPVGFRIRYVVAAHPEISFSERVETALRLDRAGTAPDAEWRLPGRPDWAPLR
jgi:hypothetical protein